MSMKRIYNIWWAILDKKTIKSTDFIFWWDSDLSVKLKLAINDNKIFTEFNQALEKITWYMCTIISWLTCINYNIWTNYWIEDAKIIAKRLSDDWLFEYDKWGRLSDAIDYIRNYHNERSKEKALSFRIKVWSQEHILAWEHNLAVQYWYFTSKAIYDDSQDDWIVEWVDFPKWYWHAVSDLWVKTTVNSYKWKMKRNIYEIKDMKKLVENWVIYSDWYLFIKATYPMEKIFKDVPDNIPFASSIKKAKLKWVVKGYADWNFWPNNPLTRAEFMWILDKLWLLDE